MINWSREKVRRFAADESGVIMAEFLILLPLLIWAFMAMMVYWDTWRTINVAQKASYAIADLVSRQSDVDMNFIDGMETVMEGLMGREGGISMRITSVQWHFNEDEGGSYSVIFSRSPNERWPELTEADIDNIAHLIPEMNPEETTVIVETWTEYFPAYRGAREAGFTHEQRADGTTPGVTVLNIGIPAAAYRNFIVTKPRFHLHVCLLEQMWSCPASVT